jgi:cyclic pyranopterin monophosphate synthase
MVRVPDVTAAVPVRRMSVARGTLRLPAAWAPDADALAAARAAAVLAAKEAPRILPAAVPFQLTDAFCDLELRPGAVEATVTVQAYARHPLSAAALLGVAAALASLADGAGPEARIEAVHIVQDVEG